VRFLDAASGAEAAPALNHPDWVFTAQFNAEGTRLVTACRDRAARIWDWRSGKLLAVLNHGDRVEGQGDEVTGAAFTPGGLVITAGRDKTVRAWDARTGRPAAPPVRLEQEIHAMELSPDGKAVLVGGIFGVKVRLIDLTALTRPDDHPVEDLLLLSEVVAGQRLAPNGALVRLTTAEWRHRFAECRRRGLVPEPERWRGATAD